MKIKLYKRRDFLAFLGGLLGSVVGFKVIGPLSSQAEAQPRSPEGYGLESLIGEEIVYNMSLLYFFNVAESKLSLIRNQKGQLEAHFQAHTKGVANWVLTPRKHKLVTVFDELKAGEKLRPISHKNYIEKGDKTKTSRFFFDYDHKKLTRILKVGSKKPKKKIYPFPSAGLFNDVLTIFYNLRLFDDLIPGRKMKLHGLPGKKKNSKYFLRILSEKEKKNNSYWSDRPDEAKTLVNAVIASDIFGTKKGVFWFFFDRNLVPVSGVAQDAVAMGDVKGKMISRKLASISRSPRYEHNIQTPS